MGEPELKPETKPEEKKQEGTIPVDLAEGVTVQMPLELAKKYIEQRDLRKQDTKSLKAKVDEFEAKYKMAEEKARLLEMAKNQDIEGIKTSVLAEAEVKLKSFESKVFRGEVMSAIGSRRDIVEEAKKDILETVMKDSKFVLDGDEVRIETADGKKEVKDVLAAFLSTRPYYLLAKTGLKGIMADPKRPDVKLSDKPINMASAIGKLIKK